MERGKKLIQAVLEKLKAGPSLDGPSASMPVLVLQTLRAAVVSTLVFIGSFWLPNLVISNLPAQNLLLLFFNIVVAIVYIIITVIAETKPAILARRATAGACSLLVLAGCVAFFLGLRLMSPVLLAAGSLAYIVGSYWLNIASILSLGTMPSSAFLVGSSAAFLLARLTTTHLLSGNGLEAAVLAAAFIALVVTVLLFVSFPHSLRVSGRSVPPQDLRLTNAMSFLPFTSRFFVGLLLTSLLFSVITSALPAGGASVSPLSATTLVFVFLYIAIGKDRLGVSPLAAFSSLITVAGAVAALTFGDALGTIPNDLAGCGVGLFELVLYWYAIYVLAQKNPLVALPTLVWGRAALALGTALGSALVLVVSAIGPIAGISETKVLVGVVTFAFAVYCALEPRGLELDTLALELAPVSEKVAGGGAAKEAVSSAEVDRSRADGLLRDCYKLTRRETDVFWLLARGRDYRHVAKELDLKLNTVKSHVRSLYAKLDIHSQQELIDLSERL